MIAKDYRSMQSTFAKFGARPAAALLIAIATSAIMLPAHAQSAAERAQAQALFERGKQLAREGKCSEAIAPFEESRRLEPRSGTLYNLADCYEQVGRLPIAWTTFLDAATLANQEKRTDREKDARERAATAERMTPKLEIRAPAAAATPGLEIKRDDVVVGQTQLNWAVPVDTGTHTVSASAPGRTPWQKEVTVEAGGKTTVVEVQELALMQAKDPDPPREAEPINVPPAPPAPSPPSGRSSRITTPVIIGGAATAALTIGTVVTGVLYSSKLNEYEKANDALDPNRGDLENQTKTLGAVNLALLGGAVVAAGVTAYFVIRGPSVEKTASARMELRGQVGPSFTGLSVRGEL